REIAARTAARHLQIEQPIGDAIAPHHLGRDMAHGGLAHRRRDAELGQRTRESAPMRVGFHQPAAAHGEHLVRPVGELEAAILDMDLRRIERNIAAVDIGDTRHGFDTRPYFEGTRCSPFTPSDFSLRCSAERSMPMKLAVRLILPAKRLTCASRYSRSNTSRASRKGSAMISPPLAHFSTVGVMAPISGGSMSARIGWRASPGAMIRSPSTTLRSCRTLPGHS